MLAIKIKDVKSFMAKLLSADTFDAFLLEEARIHTFNTFTIDGRRNREFYTKEELEDPEIFPYEYSQWKDVKGICFQLIKGKKVPTFMKLILHKKPEDAYTLLEEAGASKLGDRLKAFVITIKFDAGGLMLTTGTSFDTFLMDKTADLIWDNACRRFLDEKGIAFEEI